MPVKLFWNERRYREESTALRALERALPEDALVLGIDFAAPAEGVAALVSAKRAGTLTAVYPVADDPMENLVGQISRVIGEHPVHEQRYVQLHALRDDRLMVNEKPPSQNVSISPLVRNAATLVLKSADVVLASSAAEIRRWSDLIGKPLRRFAYVPLGGEGAASPALRDGITVYAPSTPRAMLRFVELALEDRRFDAEWITVENPDARPHTRIVIAPEWWRALQSAELARAGHVVAAPAHGGEERAFALPYRPLDVGGLAASVEAATTALRSYVRIPGSELDVREALEAARVPAVDGPLVSVIVRTFNRPALLARSLASIGRQTYRNVEAVVVNNGGDDVRETVERVCADLPHLYVTQPERAHISAAANAGVRAARGEYIAYLDDDDLLWPDHIARAVAALGTGADLAFSDSVAEYAEMRGDAKTLLGFQIFLDREFDRDEIFAQNFAPIHSIVHRKDLFERFGYFDESLPVTDDWEMWLRASQGTRYVHVDRPTVEYSWRFDPDRGNMTLTHQQHFVDAYRRITERYADRIAGRVLLPQLQERALAQQQHRVSMLTQHPGQLREIMLGPQLANAVPVGPLVDPAEW